MAKLDNEDKEYLAGLGRAIVRALATGVFSSALRHPDYTEAENDLQEVLNRIAAIQSGSGLSEQQMRQIVRQEIDKTKHTS